ncbi:actin assembly factor [Myxozyma melibiosi]|uniref:Actin assembly factor n=1 Tax=Myxozyma melibiosi TaxID=54550 RepID=A0ABR1FE41_9ASCO
MPSLIASADKDKIKRSIPKATNKIVEATVARLYIAYPDPTAWTFTGIVGAVALVNDLTGNTFFLKIVDIIGNRGVIWDQELYVDFQYNQDRAFFHTFELEECYAGLLFADDSEAHSFLKKVQHKEKYASKATIANKNAIALKKKPVTAAAGPRGDVLRYQKLGNNYTLAQIHQETESDQKSVMSADSGEEHDPNMKKVLEKLSEIGITEDMLVNSDPERIKELIAKNTESSASRVDKKAKGPPPPPPLQPPTSRGSSKPTPPAPLSAQSTGASTPSDGGSEASAPSGTMFKVPPPFVPTSNAPPPPANRAPLPPPSSSASPSPTGPYAQPPPLYSNTPSPPVSKTASPAPTARPPPPGQKYNVPPPLANAGSQLSVVRPPPPPVLAQKNWAQYEYGQSSPPLAQPQQPFPYGQQPAGQPGQPQFGQPGRSMPPPLPSREGGPLPAAPNMANRPVPMPPSLPPRVPVQNGLPPSFAPTPSPVTPSSTGNAPPPPPPHKHGSRNVPLPPAPPRGTNTAMAPPRPPPPPASYANNSQSSAGPPPPPPPPPQSAYGTPIQQQQPAYPSYPQQSVPPAPPMSTSSVPPAPPPPPSMGSGPPPPPPPPPGFGAPTESSAPPLPQVGGGDGRDQLLASIRGAGVQKLKKVDKTHLEKPLVVPQGGGGGGGSAASAAPVDGPGANLQDALKAALNKRKTKVAGSDDEGNEEW